MTVEIRFKLSSDKHPVTKPKMKQIEKSEQHLVGKIEELIDKAVETAEIKILK